MKRVDLFCYKHPRFGINNFMLYVVFGELLPEAILMWRSKMPALASVIGILIGLMIIYI